MANTWSTAARNRKMEQMRAAGGITHVSLHTGHPGDTGLNEAVGGTPAYARKAITIGAASGGSMATTTSIVFDVPAGTYSYVGFWNALTGGTYWGYDDIVAETFAGQGQVTFAAGSTFDDNAA